MCKDCIHKDVCRYTGHYNVLLLGLRRKFKDYIKEQQLPDDLFTFVEPPCSKYVPEKPDVRNASPERPNSILTTSIHETCLDLNGLKAAVPQDLKQSFGDCTCGDFPEGGC